MQFSAVFNTIRPTGQFIGLWGIALSLVLLGSACSTDTPSGKDCDDPALIDDPDCAGNANQLDCAGVVGGNATYDACGNAPVEQPASNPA